MLAEVVKRHADQHPDGIAATDPKESLTYAEFDRQARSLAGWLNSSRETPGPVAVCAHNSARWLVANIGLIASGALMVPLTYRTTPEELAYLLETSESRVAIVDKQVAGVLATFGDRLGCLEHVIAIDDDTVGVGDAKVLPFSEVLNHAPIEPAEIPGTSMPFTSGTTGRPKGVYRPPSRSSNSSMGSFVPLFDLQPNDVHLCAGPLYHGGPHAFAILTLALGGHVVILPRFDPEAGAASIERHRVTTTFMVPTMLRLFTKHPAVEGDRYDMSSMRVIVTAGESCPMPLKRDIARLFGPVLYEFFGATELGINAVMRPDGHEKKPGSCGKVLPDQQFVVLDDRGNPLPPGQEGELAVGSELPPEYWKDPEATDSVRRGELMSLGDTGYIDADGYLFVTGRKVDLIKTGGVRVTPGEIEEVLLEHPEVLEVAVIGLPDEVWTERITACVLPAAESRHDAAELEEWCRSRLPSHKVPKQIAFFDEEGWPRLENGKVPKRLLREQLVKQNGLVRTEGDS